MVWRWGRATGAVGGHTPRRIRPTFENLHPQTRQRLTVRQKTTRMDIVTDGQPRQSTNRRVFYDFTFSPAKSVSIAALVGQDPRIVEAHERAVTAALNQLQVFASTRVRKIGQCTDRTTGNIVAAVFRHDTSRALDPHLHTHCIVFNSDVGFRSSAAGRRWRTTTCSLPTSLSRTSTTTSLTRRLRQFGYGIENKRRGDFEIKGISPALVGKVSPSATRRLIEKPPQFLERRPEKADGNLALIRNHITHQDRPRKIKGITLAELQSQLGPTTN